MAEGFRTFFKDAVDSAKSWSDQKGTLGSDAAANTEGKTGELPGKCVSPHGLPGETLKMGTPDSGSTHQG